MPNCTFVFRISNSQWVIEPCKYAIRLSATWVTGVFTLVLDLLVDRIKPTHCLVKLQKNYYSCNVW